MSEITDIIDILKRYQASLGRTICYKTRKDKAQKLIIVELRFRCGYCQKMIVFREYPVSNRQPFYYVSKAGVLRMCSVECQRTAWAHRL